MPRPGERGYKGPVHETVGHLTGRSNRKKKVRKTKRVSSAQNKAKYKKAKGSIEWLDYRGRRTYYDTSKTTRQKVMQAAGVGRTSGHKRRKNM